MDDRVRNFMLECEEVVDDSERFLYATRAREFQVDAIERLGALKEKAGTIKAKMIVLEDEDSANCLLSLEEMLQVLISELRMWVALKDDEPNAAWDALIDAQSAARTAMQVHDIASNLGNYVERLHTLEKLLFPPQTFTSPGMTIKRSRCSICGEEYGDCNHLKCKPYMGQMCVRVIEDFDVLEFSLVEEPADKRRRVFQFSNGGGMRDIMTWRVVSGSSQLESSE